MNKVRKWILIFKIIKTLLQQLFKDYTFFYKEQVYKEPEAENWLKNKELLRNLAGWNDEKNI